MKILGINISHNQSTCLLEDGKTIYFLEDERVAGIKNFMYQDDNFYDDLVNGTIELYFIDKLKSYTSHVDYIIFTSFDRERSNDTSDNDEYYINLYLKILKDNGITYDKYVFERNNHHIYHAANGFYGSGFDDAVCLVLDGGGSLLKDEKIINKVFGNTDKQFFRETESFFQFSYGKSPEKLKQIWGYSSSSPERFDRLAFTDEDEVVIHFDKDVITSTWSNGQMFNIYCDLLGFEDGADAGKVMGLASYAAEVQGRVDPKDFELIDWFVEVNGEEITSSKIKKITFSQEFLDTFHPDNFDDHFYIKSRIAKKLQDETLNHTKKLIAQALELSSSRNVILSGGYALNCLNNYQYFDDLPEDVKLYIDPLASDAGTSLGAAKYLWYKLTNSTEKHPLTSLYLG
jgi:carbamoyltransferase